MRPGFGSSTTGRSILRLWQEPLTFHVYTHSMSLQSNRRAAQAFARRFFTLPRFLDFVLHFLLIPTLACSEQKQGSDDSIEQLPWCKCCSKRGCLYVRPIGYLMMPATNGRFEPRWTTLSRQLITEPWFRGNPSTILVAVISRQRPIAPCKDDMSHLLAPLSCHGNSRCRK